MKVLLQNSITAAGQVHGRDLDGDYQGLFTKIEAADLPPIILGREPADSLVFLMVEAEMAFSVNARDPEGAELTYQWILGEEEVGNDELVIINFPERGEFQLRVEVRDEQWMTPSRWVVRVETLLEGHSPESLELNVTQFDTVRFSIFPGNFFDPDSFSYLWVMQDDTLGFGTTESIIFQETGQFSISSWAMAEGIMDSVVWAVTVEEPNEIIDNKFSLPNSFFVDTPYPNPFNDVFTVTFGLPQSSSVLISMISVTGQVVSVIDNGQYLAGNYTLNINSKSLTAGVYFLNIRIGEFSSNYKVVYLP